MRVAGLHVGEMYVAVRGFGRRTARRIDRDLIEEQSRPVVTIGEAQRRGGIGRISENVEGILGKCARLLVAERKNGRTVPGDVQGIAGGIGVAGDEEAYRVMLS